jgi:hypothetical protein
VQRSELAGEAIPVWAGHTPDQITFWTATDLVRHDWRPSELRIVWSGDANSPDIARFVRHAAERAARRRDPAPVPAASG